MSVTVDSSESSKSSIFVVLGQVVLISVVAMIGWNIAMPGLDPAFMEAQSGNSHPPQFSILALGVFPILTAFALGQIVRLLYPHWDRSPTLVILENVTALVLAISPAYGVAQSLAAMGILVEETSIVACLVGGVALLLFLSRQVVLPSLVAGLWILWLLPDVIGLPSRVAGFFDLFRTGAYASSQLFVLLCVITGGVALAMFAIRSLMINSHDERVAEQKKGRIFLMNVVVWPPFLAMIISAYIPVPMIYAEPNTLAHLWMRFHVVAIATLLIPVFVFSYRRYFKKLGKILPLTSMLVISFTQIFLMLGGEFVTERIMVPFPFSGTTLLVLVAVIYALIDALRAPSTH